MTRRLLVGGPSNSGKSTLVLSLVRHFEESLGMSAEAIELDLWSNSYPAFAGKVPFDGRAKRFDLRWQWQPPLDERIAAFNGSTKDVVFGDMPGKLGEACAHMCKTARCDGAIVVSRTIEGLRDWILFFDDYDIPVAEEVLSMKKYRPHVMVDMARRIDAANHDVLAIGRKIIA